MAYIGKQPISGNYQVLDAIVATTTDTYALTKDTVAVFPQTPSNCIVSLNGVIQAPVDSYTISGSDIVFASALTGTDSIDFITVLGDVLSIGTPTDGTVSLAKLSATGTKDATTFLRGDNTFQTIGANTPAFFIYKSASDGDQTLSSGVDTLVVMTGEKFDTDSACASSTFTVPSGKDGKYYIQVHAQTTSGNAANESMIFKIFKNGSVIAEQKNYFVNAGVHGFNLSTILDLSASNTIQFYIQDDTSCILDSDNDGRFVFMTGFKLI
jgi:hypothetical protein